MSVKISYLQSIQAVIARLANNSFLIKGWTVTLVAALIAITGKDIVQNKKYILFGLLPALFFWFLDGYYLSLERRFKEMYDHARKLDENEIDFSMDSTLYKSRKTQWATAVFSNTLLMFYVAILATICLVYAFL